MTAEIAIINRTAVTLATDSAVTLTVRGAEKIYNCADKLFELSDKDPIGIMVYNNLEFMGVQLEVAVKKFRQEVGNVHYKKVEDAISAFFHYLSKDLAPDPELQKQHVKAILEPFLARIREEFFVTARRLFEDYQKQQRRRRQPDLPKAFQRIVQSRIAELKARDYAKGFEDSEPVMLDTYSELFDAVIAEVFEGLPLDKEETAPLREACVLALVRDEYSDYLSGMVFAGFGQDELFPSLVAYEIDGIIAGRLKKRQTEKVITDRTQIVGEILPFAQREMVDRFLYGIDPDFEGGIEDFFDVAIRTTGQEIINALSRPRKETKAKLQKVLKVGVESSLRHWREKLLPAVKNRFMQQVQDTVFLMPKQELATLALELINLTSVKRKFSSGTESVGGPIDVAVISRIDGFVWVRRKHYFEPGLNPRYFHRQHGHVA